MTEKKLDIFDLMKEADRKNYQHFNSLSETEQKTYAPLVTMRWMSGTNDECQIFFLNKFLNPYVFELHQEKELLWKLTCASSSGVPQRYKWMKPKKDESFKVTIQVICDHYQYTEKQARESLRLLSLEYILELASKYGYEKADITKIKKEFKNVGM